jgi:hypothetical protein
MAKFVKGEYLYCYVATCGTAVSENSGGFFIRFNPGVISFQVKT